MHAFRIDIYRCEIVSLASIKRQKEHQKYQNNIQASKLIFIRVKNGVHKF